MIKVASIGMLDSLEGRREDKPFTDEQHLDLLLEGMEKVDPNATETMRAAAEMWQEK